MMISGSKSQIKEKQLKDAVIYVILLIGLDGRKEIGGWYIEFGKENRTDWLKSAMSAKQCIGFAMSYGEQFGGNDTISDRFIMSQFE